jgi:hypothetical protein
VARWEGLLSTVGLLGRADFGGILVEGWTWWLLNLLGCEEDFRKREDCISFGALLSGAVLLHLAWRGE